MAETARRDRDVDSFCRDETLVRLETTTLEKQELERSVALICDL